MTIESVRRHIQRKSFVMKSRSLVTANDLYLITKIFEEKNWMAYFGHEIVINKYLDMLGKLNENHETGGHSCFTKNRIGNIELMPRQSRQPSGTGIYLKSDVLGRKSEV